MTAGRGCGVETLAVVGGREGQAAVGFREDDGGLGGVGVLRGVVERFEDAEVHGSLDLLRVAADAISSDGDGDRGLARLCGERGGQPFGGQQWRVDAVRQLPQRLNGVVGIGRQPVDDLRGLGRLCAFGQRFGDAELDLQRHQLLQTAPLLVLRGHQTPPRVTQLLETRQQVGGQLHVLEHQPGLGRELLDQLAFGRGDGLAALLGDRQRPQQLILVGDRHREVDLGELRQRPVGVHDRDEVGGSVGGRGGGGAHLPAGFQPDLGAGGAGAVGQQPDHLLQRLVGRDGLAQVRREPAKHLVGGGSD